MVSLKNFMKMFVCAAVFPAVVFGAQTSTGRATVTRTTTVNSNPDAVSSASIRHSATSVIARNTAQNSRKNRATVNARSANSRTISNRSAITRSAPETVERVNVSRVATTKNSSVGRSATNNSAAMRAAVTKLGKNISRAAKSRATAVFNDVSKIGGGYAACRDSYATCMDQFCANANDTYRRCYCSNRFVNFRKTADSLDQALTMLADFQNTNLDAVDKTAAEVNAMYSASEGEAAIKRDTSASQKMLDDISEILSGKKTYKSSSSSVASSQISTGVLDISGLFSFANSDGDAFSGTGTAFDSNTGSLFGSSSYTNMSDMEGDDLYNAAHRQCYAIAKNECGGDAAFNLARSAYSILITQDCNIYEKNINAKKESVQNTIRTAEKYLREARLEEYRAHNSADVNACLSRVESAMRQTTACGENYEKCLDYTGLYINMTNGEPVYSKALFDLNNLIKLNGSGDVLSANKDFDDFLESRKMFVTSALDTCRNIADTVWMEFKRTALIQIAQAQDAKIQSVKDSCVQTIADCYNKQTGDLEVLGGEAIAKRTGAISAIAAHDMCRDSVLACAALYGDVNGCIYDDTTKKITQNPNSGGGKCGLTSLLEYVNTVDSVRVAQGCEIGLREYAKELCSNDDADYPWGCRLRSAADVEELLRNRAIDYCGVDLIASYDVADNNSNNNMIAMNPADYSVQTNVTQDKAAMHKRVIARAGTSSGHASGINQNIITNITDTEKIVSDIVSDIRSALTSKLSDECNSVTGEGQLFWAPTNTMIEGDEALRLSPTWIKTVFGTDADLGYLKQYGVAGYTVKNDANKLTLSIPGDQRSVGWGVCMKPTQKQICAMQQGLPKMSEKYIKYNSSSKKCEIKQEDWYKVRCNQIDGYWSGQRCYVR